MMFSDDSMQAVVLIVCESHAAAVQEKLKECPEGNWFMMPAIASCRMGYWPHVSNPHAGQGCAIFGFVERQSLGRRLEALSATNEDGSLCADCVAYEWDIKPSHIAATARDPVCGRRVYCANAHSQDHGGNLFFFCSIG